MFKYISEILGKFTQGQRILALLIVLFSIVLITLGPSIISTNDCKEVYSELEKQRTELLRLNGQIIEVQTNCTNERIEREREIAKIISMIEEEMTSMEEEAQEMSSESQAYPIIIDGTDSVIVSQPIRINRVYNPDFTNVMKNIHDLQEMISEGDGN